MAKRPHLVESYTSGAKNVRDSMEFNIDIAFDGAGWTVDLQRAFILSANALSGYILNDLPDVFQWGIEIDDLYIRASFEEIDGVGGVLGGAGISHRREDGSYIPDSAIIQIDIADAARFDAMGLFDDIVLHEMIHALGFGASTWFSKGLLMQDLITGLSVFTGSQANAVYPGEALVPVEDDGGGGTARNHWDEQVFGNELMTGWINQDNYLSYMTIASLGDIGYEVISGANYVPPSWV